MKEAFEYYAVIPPDELYLEDFPLRESIGITADIAWEKFCYPALNRAGYEKDGFKAKKVLITIEVIDTPVTTDKE